MTSSSPNHNYKTFDTALATYLIIQGHLPIHIDYSQDRYEYTFPNADNTIQSLATHYVTGNAKVDPIVFTRIFRQVMRLQREKAQWREA